jgi:hypothetical protein
MNGFKAGLHLSQLISENLERRKKMGGLGSGRSTGRPTVEAALRLDIDRMIGWGAIRTGSDVSGKMRFEFYDDEIDVSFESHSGNPWDSWLRLRYSTTDDRTGEQLEISDTIYLVTSRPYFGGTRWWFVPRRFAKRRRFRSRHRHGRRERLAAGASQSRHHPARLCRRLSTERACRARRQGPRGSAEGLLIHIRRSKPR